MIIIVYCQIEISFGYYDTQISPFWYLHALFKSTTITKKEKEVHEIILS